MMGRTLRLSAALFCALAFNALLFAALAALNRPKPVEAADDAPMVLSFYEPPHEEEPVQDEPDPDPPPPHLEPVSVEIDAPVAALEPLELPNVVLHPSIPAIRLAPAVRNVSSRPQATAAYASASGGGGRAARPRQSSEIDQPPKELVIKRPDYPASALRRGLEGSVTLALLINEKGEVEAVEVVRTNGYASFRRAVLKVAKKWRFTAPRHRGRPVKAWAVKTTHFLLQDS